MPTVYRIQCTTCGSSPDIQGSLAAWVTFDGQKTGKILPESYLALRLDDGGFAPLPHPVEDSKLKSYGFSWFKASRQGRLFRITYKFCTQCGTLHEERQHSDLRTGCTTGVIAMPVVIFAYKFLFHASFAQAFSGGFLSVYVIFAIGALINWVRWRNSNLTLKLRACSKCQGTQFVTISQTAGKPFVCLSCHKQTMTVTIAGKS